MNLPQPGDYIDIHTHDGYSVHGTITIENLMAHEEKTPFDMPEQLCSYGIHPWHLNDGNKDKLLTRVKSAFGSANLFAVGEAGFDKLRGPSIDLQRTVFESQIAISEEYKKPVIIHCVRAWDELLSEYKKLKPKMPWLIHGYRGNKELAVQLLSKGFYLSFWFDFVIRQESSDLIRSIPGERFFLETDGADIDIRVIYKKVASDLNLSVEELKESILSNFNKFFMRFG